MCRTASEYVTHPVDDDSETRRVPRFRLTTGRSAGSRRLPGDRREAMVSTASAGQDASCRRGFVRPWQGSHWQAGGAS